LPVFTEWTTDSIEKAISEIKQNDTLFFDFGINSLEELEFLNKNIFKKRDDLVLYLSTNKNNYIITEDELLFLSKLKNIKKITFFGIYNKTMERLKDMTQLTHFKTMHNKTLDISFLANWLDLKELLLWGKIKNIENIKKCIRLEKVELKMPFIAEQLYFMTEMKNIKQVDIESRKKDEVEKLKKWFMENGKNNIIRDEEYYIKNS
jgi:hypothetical protein